MSRSGARVRRSLTKRTVAVQACKAHFRKEADDKSKAPPPLEHVLPEALFAFIVYKGAAAPAVTAALQRAAADELLVRAPTAKEKARLRKVDQQLKEVRAGCCVFLRTTDRCKMKKMDQQLKEVRAVLLRVSEDNRSM